MVTTETVPQAGPDEAAESPPPSEQESGEVVVGVRFQPAGKPYHFAASADFSLEPYDWVVVETVYGQQVGQITHLPKTDPNGSATRKLRDVLRRANGLDMAKHYVMQQRAERLVVGNRAMHGWGSFTEIQGNGQRQSKVHRC